MCIFKAEELQSYPWQRIESLTLSSSMSTERLFNINSAPTIVYSMNWDFGCFAGYHFCCRMKLGRLNHTCLASQIDEGNVKILG